MANPPFTLQNAYTYLTTPTHDGSGETVHPDVLYFPNGFKGGLTVLYTHILVYTPYPAGVDTYETPNAVVSNNPLNAFWKDNIPNPLEPIISGEVYSDPDLLYKDGTFYLYFRKSNGNVYVHRKTSTDLIAWSAKSTCTGIAVTILSPTVIYDPDNSKWYLWGVRLDNKEVWRWESTDGIVWTNPTLTNIPPYINYGGVTRDCWHLDVQKTKIGKKYYAYILYFTSGIGANCHYWFESSDGITWTGYDTPVMESATGKWDAGLYRATFYIANRKIKVWYSAASTTTPLIWHIGYTEADITFVTLEDTTLNIIGTPPAVSKNVIDLGKGWGFRHWSVPKTMWV